MKKGQAIIDVVGGVEGPSLYIGDENGGHRLAGPKPWGGGKTIHKFVVDVAELLEEASRFGKVKKHDYAVTHNKDGSFSVALPDGEELRVFTPQQKEKGMNIEDEYVRTYLWERCLIAVDEDPVMRPSRQWVGLTDDEIKRIEETTTCLENESWLRNLTRNLEAKLKEKNT